MGKCMGVSLGLSNSVAAVVVKEKPVAIPSAEGECVVPAMVAVHWNQERLIGKNAYRTAIINPENTVFHIQRLMGRKFNDPEVQDLIPNLPYKLIQASDGGIRVLMGGKEYSPPEISAMLLGKHKMDTEAHLGQAISKVVITVPAYFNAAQREATEEAGRLAGMEVLRIINEPTAVCLAYGFEKENDATLVLYDFGGKTFTVSILDVKDGVFNLRANKFDTCLGGNDFDQRILDFLADEFLKENQFDLRRDRQAVQRLRDAAEIFKQKLSELDQTIVSLPYICADASGPKHLNITLTREKLEFLTGDLIEHSLHLTRETLKDADLQIKDIDGIVLVGGMARMPAIEQAVRDLFHKEPYKNCPDEIVALGAAVQANIISGGRKDILYLDVTPFSLGIRTESGLSRTLIERNTTIPCHKSLIFSTVSDFQTKMKIQLLQGESHLADRNRSLGQFTLSDLPPAPRGFVQVKVDFNIDSNGILNVSACDLATGAAQHIKVEPGRGLSADESKRMAANTQQLEHNPAANQERDVLRSALRQAYVARQLESDLSARMNPELSRKLHTVLAFLNQTIAGKSADLGEANNQLGRILSEVFLGLESNGPLPTWLKDHNETPGPARAGGTNPLAGFHTLEERAGGMGIVKIVLKDGRLFAVKTPRNELLADPSAVKRFVAEARTWIGLERHSNIVCALLVRETAGQPYLFLEYADGGNLEQWLGKLPIPQVLDYAIQLCTGMSYALQKAGIVHRDLKPANILLSKDTRFRFGYAVKVTDFGLAGVWKIGVSDRLDLGEAQMSRGMGTWPYMPPEQFPERDQFKFGFRPQPVTVRSDIYSFGVLLYELLTGKLPFQSVQEIFNSSPQDPDQNNKKGVQELTGLIIRCLAKSPDQRFASFEELQFELIRIYKGLTGESYVIRGKPEELTHLDWTTRGASLVALGDFQEGQRSYEKALSLAREFPPAWQGKGQCLEYRGLFDQAHSCYDWAIQINPYLEAALLGKARCLAQKNQFGQAVTCYERAYEAQLLTSIGPE